MLLLTALLGAAAAIHFASAPAHLDEWVPLGVAFLLAGWAQAGLAVLVSRSPSRKALIAAAGVSGACIATWAMSRTVGLPFGPEAGAAEAVGTADLVAITLEALTIVLAVAAIPLRPIVTKLAASAFPALAVVGVATLALAAPSTHEHTHDETASHDHTASDLVVSLADSSGDSDDHTHAAADTTATATGHHDDTGECVGSAEEHAGADALLASTLETIKQWPDVASAEAEGFVAVTPVGRKLVHYVNPAWYADGDVLNTAHPESLLIAGNGTVVGAMYLGDFPGQDVPSPGGCLTPWHDHTNLCMMGGKVVGMTAADGSCAAGATNRDTAPMLHVWAIDRPNGPFSTIG